MSSWQMHAVACYLRLTSRRAMSSREPAQRAIAAPKGDPTPPKRLSAKHDVRREAIGAFTYYVVDPRDGVASNGQRTIVYLHGGAYIAEIAPAHWTFISALADRGARVVVPIYGLAADHMVDEALAFLESLVDVVLEATPADELVVAGDSAGAGLALALALALAKTLGRRRTSPRLLVLISPWLDVSMSNPGIQALEKRDPWLSRVGLVEAGRAWVGPNGDPRDPRASPIFDKVDGLPPVEIVVGTRDLVHADVIEFTERCAAAGTAYQLEIAQGAVHVYPFIPTPEGRATSKRLVKIITTT